MNANNRTPGQILGDRLKQIMARHQISQAKIAEWATGPDGKPMQPAHLSRVINSESPVPVTTLYRIVEGLKRNGINATIQYLQGMEDVRDTDYIPSEEELVAQIERIKKSETPKSQTGIRS